MLAELLDCKLLQSEGDRKRDWIEILQNVMLPKEESEAVMEQGTYPHGMGNVAQPLIRKTNRERVGTPDPSLSLRERTCCPFFSTGLLQSM